MLGDESTLIYIDYMSFLCQSASEIARQRWYWARFFLRAISDQGLDLQTLAVLIRIEFEL